MVYDGKILVLALMLFDEGLDSSIVGAVKRITAFPVVLKKGAQRNAVLPAIVPDTFLLVFERIHRDWSRTLSLIYLIAFIPFLLK